MERPNYIRLFKAPNKFIPPKEDDLRHNTQHPNINSFQYRKKPIIRVPRVLKYHDCFSINENGVVILGCNELTGRVWDSYVWGFENVKSYGIESTAAFKLHLDSNITNISFLYHNIFVTSEANGCVQIWSTKSENNAAYCMFMIDSKKEHTGIILAMDTLNNKNLLVTGCSHGLLKVWEINKSDLNSIHTMHNAHSDSITSISSSSNSESVFSTCSLDRSALIWDYRQQRPATCLYENHQIDFTAIHWCSYNETDNELIYLGDAAGDVYIIDPRSPNKFLENIQVHTRPITKFCFDNTKMAVIGETNLIRIYEKGNKSSNSQYECIYKDSTATNVVRDALWNPLTVNELLSIGWDSKLGRHIVS